MIVSDWKAMERKIENATRDFLMTAYGLELDIPVKINSRMKSSLGRFRHALYPEPRATMIEISKNYIAHYDWDTIYKTIKHEAIHYACYTLGKPYKDGQDYFENELKKWDSKSTGSTSYKGRVVQYACSAEKCETVYTKKRKYKNNGASYISGCCKAPIKYVGEKII